MLDRGKHFFMLKSWKQLKVRHRLVFLMLFAVLLPTVALLITQYRSQLDLREKTRIAFENSLRQTIVQIDGNLDAQLSKIGYEHLEFFDAAILKSWNGEKVKTQLTEILHSNPNLESVFVVATESDEVSYTAVASAISGYREIKSDDSPNKTFFKSPDEESILVSFVSVIQSPSNNRSAFFFAQSQCEKCPPADKPTSEKFYIYRPLSDPRDIERLSFIGISLKKDFVVNEMFPQAIAALQENDQQNQVGEIVFGAFDERQKLVYSNHADSENTPDFEAQIPLRQTFNRWTMAAGYRNNKIADLSRTYFYRNLLLLLLIVSLIVAGIFLMLGAIAKESDLAAAKSAFVSNVSHELKTPLSSIKLFTELLETERVKPEKQREYLQIISKQTRRLSELINNILDFAAIEAGRKEYKFARHDITETVAGVVEDYRLVLKESGFELETNFSEKLPALMIDPDALGQAVLNLLNNGVKYSPDRKFLRVTVKRTTDAKAAIEISDRGMGISPGEQKKIFEKFYRAGGASDVHNAKGSGLGLALVKHVAEAHGGAVTVKSDLRNGSTFTIWLPINEKVS